MIDLCLLPEGSFGAQFSVSLAPLGLFPPDSLSLDRSLAEAGGSRAEKSVLGSV